MKKSVVVGSKSKSTREVRGGGLNSFFAILQHPLTMKRTKVLDTLVGSTSGRILFLHCDTWVRGEEGQSQGCRGSSPQKHPTETSTYLKGQCSWARSFRQTPS